MTHFLAHLLYPLILFAGQNCPPGTIRVGDYFVDKVEVTNISWLEYEYHINQDYSGKHESVLPDSANFWWRKADMRFFPITNISHKQAKAYCQWRSEVVSARWGIKVIYRLPTSNEWSEIARQLIETREKDVARELRKNVRKIKKHPNDYFLFKLNDPKRVEHLFDNVSEMTSDPNIAMGGNNMNIIPPQQATTQVVQYEKPSAYLGFRCVVEIDD